MAVEEDTKLLCEQMEKLMIQLNEDVPKNKEPCVCPNQPLFMMPVCCPMDVHSSSSESSTDIEEDTYNRYDNYYNNYNIDYKKVSYKKRKKKAKYDISRMPGIDKGVTMFGTDPLSDKSNLKCPSDAVKNACSGLRAKLTPADATCHKWCAKLKFQPKPPQRKAKGAGNAAKYSSFKVELDQNAEPCKYGLPCKAQCFNHPPDMKAILF